MQRWCFSTDPAPHEARLGVTRSISGSPQNSDKIAILLDNFAAAALLDHSALVHPLGLQYLTGEKPVSAELVESVLSRQLDDLEPTLTRHGYRIKDLVEQFDAKPTEIKALFSNALDPARTTELRDRMLAAGLPI
ncbi:hypothetical protein ALP05_200039 [Pseudomonas caricapapayae]|uniref:ExeA-like protein n=1 Tax=Pseudomonas caricapapayae TaxID=46678 RepID=A0A3M6F0I4_9PSED|nr:hypothetical protein ALP05_200039 [Pseudomonas caricapapayae]